MRFPLLICAGLTLLVGSAVACRPKAERQPAWIAGAPGNTMVALSGNLGWAMRQPQFQDALRRVPFIEQSLEVFFKQARINPATESGRLSLFILSGITSLQSGNPKPEELLNNVVLMFSDFKDPKALMAAMAEAFPPEGSLVIKGREYPLHVILDFNQWHARALLDDRGQVWLGDLRTLATLSSSGALPKPVASATAWLTPGAAFQGFVATQALEAPLQALRQKAQGIPLAGELPHGIDAIAYSASPVPGHASAQRFELILSGSPQGIQDTLPWVQRLLSAASGLQGSAGLPPSEMIQEKQRIAVRCPMSTDQINQLLTRFSGTLPGLPAKPAPGGP